MRKSQRKPTKTIFFKLGELKIYHNIPYHVLYAYNKTQKPRSHCLSKRFIKTGPQTSMYAVTFIGNNTLNDGNARYQSGIIFH